MKCVSRLSALVLLCVALSACSCIERLRHPNGPRTNVVIQPTATYGQQAGNRASEADAQFRLGVQAESMARKASSDRERGRALERAGVAYDRVLELTPDDALTRARRATVRAKLGDRSGASNDIETAIRRSDGADRAYFLRRAGDLAADSDRSLSGLRYLQSLEWNPYDIATHERVAMHLKSVPDQEIADIQIANYLRFLLEYGRTERMVAAATTLAENARPDELAAATSAALAQAADVVPPEELEATAAPFLARSPAGAELRSVLEGRSTEWTWLAANDMSTAATKAPPHAAYRALAHAVGTGFAQRGDLPRAERQHRLALEMPGADMSDLLELLEFLSAYGSHADLCTTVQSEEAVLAKRAKHEQIAFRSGAMNAFAMRGACTGSGTCNVAAQVRETYAIGGAPSQLVRDLCPAAAAAPPACAISVVVPDGTSDPMPDRLSNRPYTGALFTISADDPDCAVDEALDVLRADYRPDTMPPLLLEASPGASALAERISRGLMERGIVPSAVKVITSFRRGERRVRLRFDR